MGGIKFESISLPFAPGTYIPSPTSGDTILEFVGRAFVVPDSRYSNYHRTLMVVQNSTSGAVLPGIAYSFAVTAGNYRRKLTAASASEAAEAYLVDDLLPAAGAPDGALCYVVVEGPCLCKNLASNAARNLWSIGDDIVATASGRAVVADYNLSTVPQSLQVRNKLGRAMSASTSDESSTTKLIHVGKF